MMDYELAMQQLKSDRELFLLREVTADLCLTGTFPPVQTPRTQDLVHLRTALWFQSHGGLAHFLTLDKQQRRAAHDFGLSVPEL